MGAFVSLERVLSHDDFLRGSDAYYYALQANYYAKTGAVKIPDSSFVHRATGTLQKNGLSTESALRTWQGVSLLIFFGTMTLLSLAGRSGLSFSSALVLLYLGVSPSLLFVALEFPKFFTMLPLLPLWLLPWISKRSWAPLAWSLVPLTCLLHRAALPIAAVFAVASALVYLVKRVRLSRRVWVGLATMALLLAAAFFLLPDRLRLLDFQRISWQQPHIGLINLLSRRQLPLGVKLELIVLPLLAIVLGIRLWRTHPERRFELLPTFSLWLPAFFPFGGAEVFGPGERYAILLPALSLINCLIFLREPIQRPWQTWQKFLLPILACVPALAASSRLEISHPKKLDPNFSEYRRVSEELEKLDIPMLIASKGLVFYYKYRWMREAFPYEPEKHWDKTRIWRITYAIAPDELFHYLPESCSWDGGLTQTLQTPNYILIREDCWDLFRKKILPEDDEDLYERVWQSPMNPSKHRPAFLYPKHADDLDEEFPALPPRRFHHKWNKKKSAPDRSETPNA